MSGTLKIVVIEGEFYEKQDLITAGDPYVTLTFNNQKAKTKTFHNTKKAVFKEGIFCILLLLVCSVEFNFPYDGNESATVRFELWDEDAQLKADSDDLVGIIWF
jgi:Ca2+-dependent lipid-binding protein